MENQTIRICKLSPVFSDDRGLIFDILDAPVEHVGMVTFTKAGVIRGNHFHKRSTQYTLTLKGTLKLTTYNYNNKNETFREDILSDNSFVVIPPYFVHTYESLSSAEILDITTMNRRNDGYEEDTVRV